MFVPAKYWVTPLAKMDIVLPLLLNTVTTSPFENIPDGTVTFPLVILMYLPTSEAWSVYPAACEFTGILVGPIDPVNPTDPVKPMEPVNPR
jgi:hypothetical protein